MERLTYRGKEKIKAYCDYETRDIINKLAEYEDAEEQGNADDVCEYKEQKNKFGQHIFITSCGKDLIQYGFMFEYNYCPYCGKKIRMV